MAEFVVNRDMFGRYCRISTGTSGDIHTYKIVSLIESNGYCDVPLTPSSKEIPHNKIVPVLLVIHCGVDESNVQRVALSDCEIVSTDATEVKHGNWIYHGCVSSYEGTKSGYSCSNCCMIFDEEFYENSIFNYCPNCGARMNSEDGE